VRRECIALLKGLPFFSFINLDYRSGINLDYRSGYRTESIFVRTTDAAVRPNRVEGFPPIQVGAGSRLESPETLRIAMKGPK
jgi:hypothetical protein